MIYATLSAVFSAIFLVMARSSIPKGILLLRSGWLVVQAHAANPGWQDNLESRRAMTQGGMFLVSGTMWLGGGTVTGLLGTFFAVQAVSITLGLSN